MTHPIVFRSAARADYADAARWYEERAPGVGYRFVSPVEEALVLIQESPNRVAATHLGIRRVKVRNFPYLIYFLVEHSRVVVLAILHARRNPKVWRRRE